MTRILSLLAFFLILFVNSRGAESTLQEGYLKSYLMFQPADHLEKEGYLRLAYAEYSDGLQRLIVLHDNTEGFEPEMYKKKVHDVQVKLAELKKKFAPQAPLPLDDTYHEFLRLELYVEGAMQVNVMEDLKRWQKFQTRHPDWEPQLISARISNDEKILAKAKDH